jgi:hypothetical protein
MGQCGAVDTVGADGVDVEVVRELFCRERYGTMRGRSRSS